MGIMEKAFFISYQILRDTGKTWPPLESNSFCFGCPKCLGYVYGNPNKQLIECPECGYNPLDKKLSEPSAYICPSSHGAAGYITGTVIHSDGTVTCWVLSSRNSFKRT